MYMTFSQHKNKKDKAFDKSQRLPYDYAFRDSRDEETGDKTTIGFTVYSRHSPK